MDALTYTCADTYAPSHLPDTIIHQGATANKAEDAKKKKYAFLMDRFIFVPVAMETSGGFASEGLSFLREVGRRIGARTGQANATTFLIQRLSLATQRGNVASILGTSPKEKSWRRFTISKFSFYDFFYGFFYDFSTIFLRFLRLGFFSVRLLRSQLLNAYFCK